MSKHPKWRMNLTLTFLCGIPITTAKPLNLPQREDDSDICVGRLTDELLAVRAQAEAVRNYFNRIIVKVDELLDVLDEADWDFDDEEENA